METEPTLSRRSAMLRGACAVGAAVAAPGVLRGAAASETSSSPNPGAPVIKNGRINQSMVHWCFKEHWDVEKACQVGKQLGLKSVEIVAPEFWPTLKKYGLVCACAPSHGFKVGFNDPADWPHCTEILTKQIDACAAAGFPTVITFTGYKKPHIDDATAADNCVKGLKEVAGYAEKNKVTLVLEMLNSRYSKNMIGHPGYQGDHTEYCVDIIKRVGSDRLKLLFDIYHVQIMDGDVITRIHQHKDLIGHVHTAGNPGRGELDEMQEINYPPIMKALVDIGYKGYVGQEFIPTRDPMEGMIQAVTVCDV
jgi:hydroxypyruvate isomerase